MKRQAWILSAWATLGSSLLAGCVRPTGDRRPPEIPVLPTRLQPTQAQASLQSPYHAQPAELLARGKNGSGVVRTRHAIEIPADPQAVPGTEPQERVVERPGPERDPQPPPRPKCRRSLRQSLILSLRPFAASAIAGMVRPFVTWVI
jgi:hypothetical protein